jgi:hypothetical protein
MSAAAKSSNMNWDLCPQILQNDENYSKLCQIADARIRKYQELESEFEDRTDTYLGNSHAMKSKEDCKTQGGCYQVEVLFWDQHISNQEKSHKTQIPALVRIRGYTLAKHPQTCSKLMLKAEIQKQPKINHTYTEFTKLHDCGKIARYKEVYYIYISADPRKANDEDKIKNLTPMDSVLFTTLKEEQGGKKQTITSFSAPSNMREPSSQFVRTFTLLDQQIFRSEENCPSVHFEFLTSIHIPIKMEMVMNKNMVLQKQIRAMLSRCDILLHSFAKYESLHTNTDAFVKSLSL